MPRGYQLPTRSHLEKLRLSLLPRSRLPKMGCLCSARVCILLIPSTLDSIDTLDFSPSRRVSLFAHRCDRTLLLHCLVHLHVLQHPPENESKPSLSFPAPSRSPL